MSLDSKLGNQPALRMARIAGGGYLPEVFNLPPEEHPMILLIDSQDYPRKTAYLLCVHPDRTIDQFRYILATLKKLDKAGEVYCQVVRELELALAEAERPIPYSSSLIEGQGGIQQKIMQNLLPEEILEEQKDALEEANTEYKNTNRDHISPTLNKYKEGADSYMEAWGRHCISLFTGKFSYDVSDLSTILIPARIMSARFYHGWRVADNEHGHIDSLSELIFTIRTGKGSPKQTGRLYSQPVLRPARRARDDTELVFSVKRVETGNRSYNIEQQYNFNPGTNNFSLF